MGYSTLGWRTFGATLVLAVLAVTGDARGETSGQIDLHVGQRSLDDDFAPADDARAIGVGLSIGRPGWAVQIAADVMTATDDASRSVTIDGLPVTSDTDIEILELDLGMRRFFGDGRVRGYVGGGVAWVEAEVEGTLRNQVGTLLSSESDDSDLGLWVNAGGGWRFAERFHVGLDLRYTDADVQLVGDRSIDAGGLQVAVTVGVHW